MLTDTFIIFYCAFLLQNLVQFKQFLQFRKNKKFNLFFFCQKMHKNATKNYKKMY